MPDIHSSAIVHPHAQLADSVKVGPFAVIEADVTIGENTTIGPHCMIDNGARIGSNCRIHHGAVIATPPQDLKYKFEKTEAFIGDNTEIREYATVNRGTPYSWKVVVGGNCLLMAYSHVAHDCVIGDNVILANSAQLGGHVEIGRNAIIGGLTAIHQFCHIGPFVMVSGASGTNKDIPPYVRAGHFPVQYAGLNVIGLRRNGFSREAIDAIHECYRIIYHSGRNVSQALEHIQATMPTTPEVETIIQFITSSPRGIIRAARTVGADE